MGFVMPFGFVVGFVVVEVEEVEGKVVVVLGGTEGGLFSLSLLSPRSRSRSALLLLVFLAGVGAGVGARIVICPSSLLVTLELRDAVRLRGLVEF